MVVTRQYANLGGVAVGDGYPVRIVGVINVSPESFYEGSVAPNRRALRRRAVRMVAEGADILDVGAMSTAPYKRGGISEPEELSRLVDALQVLRAVVGVPIAVDTQRSRVAAAALAAGANIINDISGLAHDARMARVAAGAAGVIAMANELGPSTAPPTQVVLQALAACMARAVAAGVPRERIVLDPGIGFFRRAAVPWHVFDCAVLRDLGRLRRFGRPLLVGASRKSFVGRLTGHEDPAGRLSGSLAAAALAVANGAALVRAHDVAATVDAVRVAEAVRGD